MFLCIEFVRITNCFYCYDYDKSANSDIEQLNSFSLFVVFQCD